MRITMRSLQTSLAGARDGIRTFLQVSNPILRPFYKVFRVILALLTVEVLIQSCYPLLYGKLTDALVARQATISLLLFGALILQGLVHYAIAYRRELYEIDHLDWVMNLRIMTESLERIAGFSLAQCSRMHSGKARDIVRKGRVAIRHLVYLGLYRIGPNLLRLAVALAYLTWVSLLIGGVATITTLAYGVFSIAVFMRLRAPIKALDDRDNENGKMFADTLANMEVVMAYARQRQTVKDFEADGQELVDQSQGFWRGAVRWYFAGHVIAFFSKYAIMGATAWMLFGDRFSFGTYVALTQWAMMAVNATQELSSMQREVSGEWAHAELYLELLRKPPEIVSLPDAPKPARLRGHIVFDQVTFSYEPRVADDPLKVGEPVIALNDVSFEITGGQTVALVGESGAGKSTIAYALMRARDPESGTVSIDNTDLRKLDLNSVRRRIGYVPQHPRLFDRSLRYNLTFGLDDPDSVDDEWLGNVLRMVKLEKLAANGGLGNKLGEGGHTLSGGERQRLCIARALVKDPDILIFDEATSSLDPVNEKKVQDEIDAVAGRTKIVIAHRYSTIQSVERILVFDAGRLTADGTHDALLDSNGYYRELLQQQGLL